MTLVTCTECDEKIDTDKGGRYSIIKEQYYCGACFESDSFDASKVIFIDETGVKTITVGDAFQLSEYGDNYDKGDITRQWVASSPQRGYYETTVEGFTTVIEGWTTGGWDDPVGERKALFNDWLQSLTEQEVSIPFTVVIALEPTSNLFSTAVSVMVKDNNKQDFIAYLGEELPALKEALS